VLQTDVVDCIGCLCGVKAADLLTEFSEVNCFLNLLIALTLNWSLGVSVNQLSID